MNAGNRIKEVRKYYKLSQDDFGSRLGVSGAAISRIEGQQRALTPQIAKLICKEFHIREEWLVNGTGTMTDENVKSKKNINEAIQLLDTLEPELQEYAIQQIKGLLNVQNTMKK